MHGDHLWGLAVLQAHYQVPERHPVTTHERWELSPRGAVVPALEWDPRVRRHVWRGRRCTYLRDSLVGLRVLLARTRRHPHLVSILDLRPQSAATADGLLVDVFYLKYTGGTLAEAPSQRFSKDQLRCILLGALQGLCYLNVHLQCVHHHVRPAAVLVTEHGVGVLGDLADVAPVDLHPSVLHPSGDDKDGLVLLPPHDVDRDQAAMLLCIISVLSGVDWGTFLATHPPSLRLYRDLLLVERLGRPGGAGAVPPPLLTELDRLCDAYPATLLGGVWGPYYPVYHRMVSALQDHPAASPTASRGRAHSL
jgi:hypothetical protein